MAVSSSDASNSRSANAARFSASAPRSLSTRCTNARNQPASTAEHWASTPRKHATAVHLPGLSALSISRVRLAEVAGSGPDECSRSGPCPYPITLKGCGVEVCSACELAPQDRSFSADSLDSVSGARDRSGPRPYPAGLRAFEAPLSRPCEPGPLDGNLRGLATPRRRPLHAKRHLCSRAASQRSWCLLTRTRR